MGGESTVQGRAKDGSERVVVTLDREINTNIVLPSEEDFYLDGYTLVGWSFFDGDYDAQIEAGLEWNNDHPTDTIWTGLVDYNGTQIQTHFAPGQTVAADNFTQNELHDRMIAHTSQLAHVVSNSYVKSPVSANYVGFSGGSYKDMTRIACLDERIWKELFILNRDALLPEIDNLLSNIQQIRDAIAAGDETALEGILRRGREAKESIDAVNPDQPSD